MIVEGDTLKRMQWFGLYRRDSSQINRFQGLSHGFKPSEYIHARLTRHLLSLRRAPAWRRLKSARHQAVVGL
jgi:hypothetical protein